MKKIVFILLLAVFSAVIAPAQANGRSDIDKTYLTKISLAEAEYNAALAKWKEVDQVKIVKSINIVKDTGCKPSSVDRYGVAQSKDCVVDVNVFNTKSSNGINSLIRLSTQDGGSRNLGPTGAPVGPILSGEAKDSRYGHFGIPGGDNVIYQLVAGWNEWEKPNWIDFNWDFDWQYSQAGMKWEVPAKTILSFDLGWIYPVKIDGTRIPYSEFSTARNNVKTSYANIQTLKNEYTNAINEYYAAEAKAMEKAKREADEKAEAQANAKLMEEAREEWAKQTNKELSLYFPAKAKSNLMKQGYFKPLKTTSYTYETGRYIANARVSGNTATVTGYWETKTVYDVPTKKEQAAWIKESNNKLNQVIKQYNTLVAEAKMRGYTVICAANTPCKVQF